jgi:pSer/pThr/pTyr-binding forkhead associated (FHA) protein
MTDHGTSSPQDLSQFALSGSAGDLVLDGEPAQSVYFVQEGEFEVMTSNSGHHGRAKSCGPGQFFGEGCLLEGRGPRLTVRACSHYRLLALPPEALEGVISENPRVALEMLAQLAERASPSADRAGDVPAHATGPVACQPGPSEADAGDTAPGPATSAPRAAVRLGDPPTTFTLPDEGQTTIGRPDPDAGFLPDIDLAPFEGGRSASRRHARIVCRQGGYALVEETGVTNGTFVNGKRISPEQPVDLSDGDEIAFAHVRAVFQIHPAKES